MAPQREQTHAYGEAAGQQIGRRLRHQDLAAVATGPEPGRAVQRLTPVVRAVKLRLGGVQRHPHPEHVTQLARQRLLGRHRRRGRVRRLREGRHRRIALTLLDGANSTVRRDRGIQQLVVAGDRRAHPIRGRLPGPRRTLHVRQQERHRPRRQRQRLRRTHRSPPTRHHNAMPRPVRRPPRRSRSRARDHGALGRMTHASADWREGPRSLVPDRARGACPVREGRQHPRRQGCRWLVDASRARAPTPCWRRRRHRHLARWPRGRSSAVRCRISPRVARPQRWTRPPDRRTRRPRAGPSPHLRPARTPPA